MYPGQRVPNSNSVDSLLQSCSTYKTQFVSRISQDVNDALMQWKSLKAETDVHYSNDGTSKNLVVLNGTVPIFYNGSQYNIPMSFWISENYPLSPPLAYVTPTSTMQVARNHDNVSPDGTVYLPYLNQWNPSHSNLNGLISTCKAVFSTFPPVHARAPETRTPPSQPPPPTYSSFSGGGSYPGARPPYPSPAASSTSTSTPPPPPYPGAQPPPAVTVKRTSEDERQQVAARKERELKTARQAVEVKLQNEYQRFRARMKTELGSEISTQRKLEEGQKTIEEGIKKLEAQKSELQNTLSELNSKQAQLETWLAEYGNTDDEANSALAQMNLDEAIVPADAVSRQLFDCVSETSAIDDVLYNLDRALTNDVVDLQTFLKEVRKLARKQFFSKALGQKILKHQQKLEMQSRHQPPLNSRPPPYQSRYP